MGDTGVGGTRESPVPMASGRPQGCVPAYAQAPAVQHRFTRPPLALPANPALSRTPMTRTTLLTAALLLASLQAHATRGTPATTLPLPPPAATPADSPLQRQTGMTVLEGSHGGPVIIRSVEPDSLVGGDRLDFTVLDADGDGAVDRREAASDASLRAEFDRVDANRDGRLDRDELAGWIL